MTTSVHELAGRVRTAVEALTLETDSGRWRSDREKIEALRTAWNELASRLDGKALVAVPLGMLKGILNAEEKE